jgi:microcystin-dependent protein
MATVTGYTAEKMKQIEDSTVVDGTISGDDLILLTRDGTPINAGNVRGPQGVPGPAGDADAVNLASPIGSIVMFGGGSPPAGWLLCDGQSYVRTNYQALFDEIGTAFGSVDSTHFNVPDLQQRFPIGRSANIPYDAVGKIGGSADAVVVDHAHPHAHTMSSAGDHRHLFYGLHNTFYVQFISVDHSIPGVPSGQGNATPVDMDTAGNHSHNVGQDSTRAGSDGSGKNVPPFVVINFIIRF